MLHSRIEAPRSLLEHLSVIPWLAALIEFDSLRCIGFGRHQDWSGIDGDLEAHTQGMKESAFFFAHPPVHGRNLFTNTSRQAGLHTYTARETQVDGVIPKLQQQHFVSRFITVTPMPIPFPVVVHVSNGFPSDFLVYLYPTGWSTDHLHHAR
jgi:hypothetical protein